MFEWIIRVVRRLFGDKLACCYMCGKEFAAELVVGDYCGPCWEKDYATCFCDDCGEQVGQCECEDLYFRYEE